MSIRPMRSGLYRTARLLGDLQALARGPRAAAKRIQRRLLGRMAARIIRRVVGR